MMLGLEGITFVVSYAAAQVFSRGGAGRMPEDALDALGSLIPFPVFKYIKKGYTCTGKPGDTGTWEKRLNT